MKTFGGIDKEFAELHSAEIILQSIPYDGTSTWGKGADYGFEAFLVASENMELYDIETGYEVYKKGIYMPEEWSGYNSPELMFESVYEGTKRLLDLNKFLTFFGGEHSISIGIVKAFYERFKNISILQLDAHADLRPTYEGSKYNHACALHDASLHSNLVQVGIRSMDITEKPFMNMDKVYFAQKMDDERWMQNSLEQLTQDVYITLDLDVFDPSIMPATGTPEPGGLQWNELVKYLALVFENRNVIGFDIVELAPIAGLRAPQFLAAKLYYKMLSYKFSAHAS